MPGARKSVNDPTTQNLDKRLGLSIPLDISQMLAELSSANRRSLNSEILACIEECHRGRFGDAATCALREGREQAIRDVPANYRPGMPIEGTVINREWCDTNLGGLNIGHDMDAGEGGRAYVILLIPDSGQVQTLNRFHYDPTKLDDQLRARREAVACLHGYIGAVDLMEEA